MRIALCQRFSKMKDKSKNIEMIRKAVKDTDADLVIFPEAFLTGYVIRDDFFSLAETIPGPSSQEIASIAENSGKGILFGMVRKDDSASGHLYNSAVYASPKGELDYYDKTYPVNFGPFEERFYFGEGNDLPLFQQDGFRFGTIICYDIFFPELTKAYAMMGADFVACISASPSATRPFFEKVMATRAIENTIYFAYANVVGTQGNLVFWGGNAVIGPRGNTLAKGEYYEEDTVTADLSKETLRMARENRPTIRDSMGRTPWEME